MKEKLLFCVLLLVFYKCDAYGPKPSSGLLGGLLSQGVGVLEGIANGGLTFQGQFNANSQQNGGSYHKPPVQNNYGGYRPQKPVETIVVVVEEAPQQNQYAHQHGHYGQNGQGYGYRPSHHYNQPNYPNKPGYNDFGGNHNNGPWNNGYGHRPPHHRPGYGYNPHGHYHNHGNNYGNQIPNNNNGNFDQNPQGNIPIEQPNHPFDRPINSNNDGNFNQNPQGNIPTDRPNRPFDRPINNNNNGNIPTDAPNRPFDRPINNDNNGNIPTDPPNRPFDRPINNNNGNVPTDPPNRPFDRPINNNNYGNIPTDPPNRPFDRPITNNNNGNIPTDPPSRPFDRPVKDNNDNHGIPTYLPNQGGSDSQNRPNFDQKPTVTSTTENTLVNVEKTTKKPKDDDMPLFVPLNPNQYVYGGDKIEINAPKRETNEKPQPAEEDYSDSNIDPLDVRIGDKP